MTKMKPITKLRDAAPSDIPAIAAIYAHHVLNGTGTFEETPPDESEMRARLRGVQDAGLPWIVAERDGAIKGYAYAKPYHTRSAWRLTLEDSVYVDQRETRTGVGRLMLQEIIARCSVMNYGSIIAVIGDSANDGSVGLHAACGFDHVGVLRHAGLKFGRRLDVILMQRTLNRA